MSKLEEAEQKWFEMAEGEGLNPKLMSVANAVLRENPDYDEDAVENYLLDMGTRRWGTLEDQFKKDCRRAAEKVVKNMSNSSCKEEKTEVHHLTAVTADYSAGMRDGYALSIFEELYWL